MLINRRCHFDEPCTVFGIFQHIFRGEKLDAVGRRIAQRLEQAGVHQRRNIMRLAIERPCRLLRRQAGRQVSQERQESMLIVFHAKSDGGAGGKRTRLSIS